MQVFILNQWQIQNNYFEFSLSKNTYYNLADSAFVFPFIAQDAVLSIHKVSLSKSLHCFKIQKKEYEDSQANF